MNGRIFEGRSQDLTSFLFASPGLIFSRSGCSTMRLGLVVLFLCLVSSVWSRSLEPANDDDGGEPAFSDSSVELGTCWQTFGNEDRCTEPYLFNVTKADCCANGVRRLSTGWTPYTIGNGYAYFQYVVLGNSARQCQACFTTCDKVNCSRDSICRLVQQRPQCVCDRDCSKRSNLHPGPVCGFDGKTYSSECSVIYNNCRNSGYVDIDYVGTCQYSCQNVTCSEGNNCMMDQNGIPHCGPCLVDCPSAEETPRSERVCGGDGVTYASTCHLARQTCLNGRSIRLAYRGSCRAGLTCATARCGSDRCLMDETSSTPVCVNCDRPCYSGRGRNSICGSDNVTYSNYCAMARTACSRRVIIDTKHYGMCGRIPSVELVI